MKLSEVCFYVTDRIDCSTLNKDSYISTENMFQNCGGVSSASCIPNGNCLSFKKGDILFSNIRPYFKKLWKATFDGGCSNDVLCIRSNDKINPTYLYYMLTQDSFISYVMKGSKGCKMPRGDKKYNMNWEIDIPSLSEQRRIASILSSLDDKIAVNRRICENLEAQAQALFKHWFIDFAPFKDGKFVESELGMIPEGWRVGTLGDIAKINPTRSLKKGTLTTYLDMKNMPTSGSFPSAWEKKEFTGGMKFKNNDTLMARITPCLENGKVAFVNFLEEDEIAFGSTEYIVMTAKEVIFPELLYTLCRFPSFVSYATKNMNGSSGRQRVSGDTIAEYKMVIAPEFVYSEVSPLFHDYMIQIRECGFENLRLSTLRDTLLPKLMSGQIKL